MNTLEHAKDISNESNMIAWGGSPTEVGPVSPRSTANSDNRLPKDSLLHLRITFFKSVIPLVVQQDSD
jgi:hypothetical protein